LDSEGNGVPDWVEELLGTNPLLLDSRGDDLANGSAMAERFNLLNPEISSEFRDATGTVDPRKRLLEINGQSALIQLSWVSTKTDS